MTGVQRHLQIWDKYIGLLLTMYSTTYQQQGQELHCVDYTATLLDGPPLLLYYLYCRREQYYTVRTYHSAKRALREAEKTSGTSPLNCIQRQCDRQHCHCGTMAAAKAAHPASVVAAVVVADLLSQDAGVELPVVLPGRRAVVEPATGAVAGVVAELLVSDGVGVVVLGESAEGERVEVRDMEKKMHNIALAYRQALLYYTSPLSQPPL